MDDRPNSDSPAEENATERTTERTAEAAPSKDDAYLVVARRYRPQTFEELIGQEHVGRALGGAITTNRVGHAYLFTGARGVGKTSAARIFAKALNCKDGPSPTPCNACDSCDAVSAGSDIDVLEIDGASNRGIDEIRQLRANVGVRPSRSRFKVYIIDEVHMLTREAFNALLKTLEEPPEHVKFIFCTTEPNKIPITVLSRCQRFDFGGIATDAIATRLAQIAQAEGVEADTEALEVLARRAAGSMRDSQSLLEQLLSFGGERITTADVHAMLGTADWETLDQMVDALATHDAAAALSQLDGAISAGSDPGQLMQQLLGYFRDVMAVNVGCDASCLLHTTSSRIDRIADVAQSYGLETILAITQIVDQSLARMKQSTHARTLAEVALVRICNLEDLDALGELIGQLRDGGTPAAPISPGPRHGDDAGKTSQDRGGTASPAAGPSAANPQATPPKAAAEQAVPQKPEPAETMPFTPENVDSIWSQALEQLSEMAAQQARQCQSVAISAPNRLVVTFPAEYTFSKQQCERPEQAARLMRAVAQVVGTPVKIDFAVAEPAASEQPKAAPARAPSQRELISERADQPMVRRAVELFDAEIIRVAPGESSS
ncbi:MAG: DNA polymerase III subunit gamma/tau [Planctomycetes bacterium]|nr:DNA polymerase III subunit gamma/tau [Planctomycetota bacterium]